MHYIIVDNWSAIKTFDTLQGARVSLTRKYKNKYPNAVIMDHEEFKRHKENEPYREVINIMTKEKVMERVSTPHYLSVGSETYWST